MYLLTTTLCFFQNTGMHGGCGLTQQLMEASARDPKTWNVFGLQLHLAHILSQTLPISPGHAWGTRGDWGGGSVKVRCGVTWRVHGDERRKLWGSFGRKPEGAGALTFTSHPSHHHTHVSRNKCEMLSQNFPLLSYENRINPSPFWGRRTRLVWAFKRAGEVGTVDWQGRSNSIMTNTTHSGPFHFFFLFAFCIVFFKPKKLFRLRLTFWTSRGPSHHYK